MAPFFSTFSSFVVSGMLLLAAISHISEAAPTRFMPSHHHHNSVSQGFQHGPFLSKKIVSPRHEGPHDSDDCRDVEADEGAGETEVVASGWYPSWEKGRLPVTEIPWEQYSQLTFAFAIPRDNGTLDLDGQEETLRAFSTAAKANGVDPYVSLGGFTGSRFFSPLVSTPANRTAFVKEIVKMAADYELAGIDFDWEYPNGGNGLGLGCNMHSPDDTANFLALLKELKQDPVGKTLSLTAAAHIAPFRDAAGVPSKDISAFAEVFDQIAIMAYDIHGPWLSNVGANAPLNAQDANGAACPAGRDGSVATAVEAWTSAGFPSKKLVLAVAAYGRAFHPTSEVLNANGEIQLVNPTHNETSIPYGEGEDESTDFGTDVCGAPAGPSGVFNLNGLISSGLLDSEAKPTAGIAYLYDNCTQTPFIYDRSTNVMISYDDDRSMKAKGSFIVEKGMLGFAMWHIVGDTRDNLLTNALWESMGIIKKGENQTEVEQPTEEDGEDC